MTPVLVMIFGLVVVVISLKLEVRALRRRVDRLSAGK